MFAIDGDVGDGGLCILYCRAELFKILRIGSRKVPAPGLDFIYIEFLDDVSREVFELNGPVLRFVFGPGNELTERI